MTDPHSDDYCVVCNTNPKRGLTMHPVSGIVGGCLCDNCISEEHGQVMVDKNRLVDDVAMWRHLAGKEP